MGDANILFGPKESTTEINFSIGELLLNQLAVHGSRVGQVNVHTGEEQTFEHILNLSKKLALFLRKEGLKPNDAIAVCSENNLKFCIPICAAFYLGAVACPLNPLYSKNELKHALTILKPKYIFISPLAVDKIKDILKELHWLPTIFTIIESDVVNVLWKSINNAISNIHDNDVNVFQAESIDVNDHVTAILFSSGTTGLPKGVMLTNKNLTTVIRHMIDPMSGFYNKDAISLALLPFFHAYSFTVMIVRLIVGNVSIVFSRFEEKLFLYSIQKYRISHLTLVPPLMVFLAKHPLVDKYDLSSIDIIWCGAAPLSEEIQKAVSKRLNVLEIKQGYGLTETTLAVLRSPTGKTKFGSVGILAPGMSAKVIPLEAYETEITLGPNCKGELCFKGALIMKSYYNDEKSTAEMIDKDGWLHTGDVGYYDEEGYFYIVDRIKELIKYKGYQVPPAELEALILTCPGVKDVAVIGIPDEEAGELPMAFIVKQDSSKIDKNEIMQYVNERVSNPKRLRGGVKFVDNIPKTPSGKILRRLLRDTLKSKL